MAKSKTAATEDDVKPADGFAAAGDFDSAESTEKAEDLHAELERLRAENALLKAAAGPVYVPGAKYKVSLRDGPAAVVECKPLEHPFEAFKRVTGVRNSMHAPQIQEMPADAEVGIIDPRTGQVRKRN